MFQVPNFPVVIHNLADYGDIIDPFIAELLEGGGDKWSLGPDGETNKLSIWDNLTDNPYIAATRAIFDGIVLEFANEVHPDFKGKGMNYELDRDAWLNKPESWQGTRIHRHWQPFLWEHEIGDVVTLFYPQVPLEVTEGHGDFMIFAGNNDHQAHEWLPDDVEPKFTFVPKKYDLLLMTADTWHMASPFRCERYSLATDVKLTQI
jgi:hypothetical protein